MEGACWSPLSVSALKKRKRRRSPNFHHQDVLLDLRDLQEHRDPRVTGACQESVDPKEKRGKLDVPVQRGGQEPQDFLENRVSRAGLVQKGQKEKRVIQD